MTQRYATIIPAGRIGIILSAAAFDPRSRETILEKISFGTALAGAEFWG